MPLLRFGPLETHWGISRDHNRIWNSRHSRWRWYGVYVQTRGSRKASLGPTRKCVSAVANSGSNGLALSSLNKEPLKLASLLRTRSPDAAISA